MHLISMWCYLFPLALSLFLLKVRYYLSPPRKNQSTPHPLINAFTITPLTLPTFPDYYRTDAYQPCILRLYIYFLLIPLIGALIRLFDSLPRLTINEIVTVTLVITWSIFFSSLCKSSFPSPLSYLVMDSSGQQTPGKVAPTSPISHLP